MPEPCWVEGPPKGPGDYWVMLDDWPRPALGRADEIEGRFTVVATSGSTILVRRPGPGGKGGITHHMPIIRPDPPERDADG